MLVDWCEEQYQLSMVHGVADFAKEKDLNFLCFEGGGIKAPFEYESRRNIVYDLVNGEIINGLVILSPTIGHFVDYTTITKFCNRFTSLPVVSIGLAMPNIHSVIIDNFGGMRDLVTHFITVHGYRNFAFIKGPEDSQDANDRFNSFQETLLDFNIRPDPNLMVDGDFVAESGEAAIRTLLDKRHAKFEVVIAANDNMALGALNELNARGIKVPEQIALAGFDNLDFSVYTAPPLTTISYSLYHLGWRAAETVMSLIEKKEVPRETILPANLIVRRSCGCFAHQLDHSSLEMMEPWSEAANITISKHKHQIISRVIQQTHYIFHNKDEIDYNGMIENLFDAFFDEFTSREQQSGKFVQELAAIFTDNIWVSRDIFTWQSVITEFRRNLLPFLYHLNDIAFVENLWHQARVLIGNKALILEKFSHQQYIKANQIISSLREELLFTLDQTQIFNILAQNLPSLGIKSCYLMTFKGKNQRRVKSVLAYDENGWIYFGDEELMFLPEILLPKQLLPEYRRYSMLVETLNFSSSLFGLVIFELEPQTGKVYGELRRIICSTLQSATLFKQIQEQASRLRTQKGDLSRNLTKLRKVMGGFIEAIAQTVETRDPYTAGHQRRVADLACAIAGEMKLPREIIEGIRTAGIVHDLGKISVPAEILNKPGRLKDIEFNLIKSHPMVAYDILKTIDFPWPIALIVLQHHERLDGSGYPGGLCSKDILLEAKVLCVADVVEAMASHRPYRPSLGIEIALEEIIKNRGLLYDTEVVDSCLTLFRTKGYKFN
jgi:HD-GYP domain-containing protein (c-di-GMP phosphodiesterase class II)/DNA-binding LacI/PurR family transcriptional regulator